jgi:glycosyltransferase involved in cell wall biosynthesis
MRAIALVSDAYGGRGGIACYNRNFLRALCSYPAMEEVIALPRSVTYGMEEMPVNLVYRTESAGGRLRYLTHCLRLALFGRRADLIVCGHLHLLPFAWLIGIRHRCPVVPITYGIEAWTPTAHGVANTLSGHVRCFISIRRFTASRFKAWTGNDNAVFYYLPNCIDQGQFGPAPKRTDLLAKLDLEGRKVVMTAGRIDSTECERRKGFDEVLEALPELRRLVPEIAYLILGDGDDKPRLEAKAKDLGVAEIVRFSGYVSEADKPDYYRLADVFAMPGSNPVFDRYPFRFVFLEALACGVPVVGCRPEGAAEQDDADVTALITQVDPNDKADIIRGIRDGLARRSTDVAAAMNGYYYPAFRDRLHGYVSRIVRGKPT